MDKFESDGMAKGETKESVEEEEHCPHCREHHSRLERIEKRLGMHHKEKSKDEILRERKRA